MVPDDADVTAFYEGPGDVVDRIEGVCDRHGLDLEDFWAELEAQNTALQCHMIESGERTLYDDVGVVGELGVERGIGLVSNNTHATIEFLVEHAGWGDHVDVVYGRDPTVEGYRRRKPDPHYVERALGDLGAESAILVGDREQDVVAARRAGIDAALLGRDGGEGGHSLAPDVVLAGLADLLDVL